MKRIVTTLLQPLAAVFKFGVWVRYQLYSSGIFKRIEFDRPVICVGNLSVGGTGKTPMVEFLLRLLKDKKAAVLSRGYKRRTSGFRWVLTSDTHIEAGDEPAQIKRKFPEVLVAVDKHRDTGISQIVQSHPDTDMVILDDAMQHLAVKPSFTIMLTSYDNPFFEDHILPAGLLRESRSAAKRADVIVVTKCPAALKEIKMDELTQEIRTYAEAPVFFATLDYGKPYDFFSNNYLDIERYDALIAVAATASNDTFEAKVKQDIPDVSFFGYPDHHEFSQSHLKKWDELLSKSIDKKCGIVTTEKDAIRMEKFHDAFRKKNIDLICQPVQMQILNQEEIFGKMLSDHINEFF